MEHSGSAHRHHFFQKDLPVGHQAHGHPVSGLRFFHHRRYRQGRCSLGGNGGIIDDAGFGGSRFQPHALPDTAHGCVPDTGRVGDLLAARLLVVVSGVQHLHHQLLLSLFQEGCNIEAEGRVAAGMQPGPLAVHPNLCTPIHRLEVEPDLLSLPFFRDGEGGAVPEGIIGRNVLTNAGEGAFDGKRHQDFPLCLRLFTFLGADGIVPQAVERDPALPRHLRTGVFRQGILRIHLFRPTG